MKHENFFLSNKLITVDLHDHERFGKPTVRDLAICSDEGL